MSDSPEESLPAPTESYPQNNETVNKDSPYQINDSPSHSLTRSHSGSFPRRSDSEHRLSRSRS